MTISGDPVANADEAAAATTGVGDGNKKRPYLVFCATNAAGHTTPMLQIAAEMIQRGFEGTFVGGEDFHAQIKRMGAEHVPTPPILTPEKMEFRAKMVPPGLPLVAFDLSTFFVAPGAQLFKILTETLEKIRERRPDQQVVIVHETFFMGCTAMMYGTPLPKGYAARPRVVDINLLPLMVHSADLAPFGPGLPPDSTPSGRARNQLLVGMFFDPMGPLAEPKRAYREQLQSLGATAWREFPENLLDGWQTSYDVTLQMCSPSLEYPRPDLPANVKFAGCLPRKPLDPNYQYPEWWGEVTTTAAAAGGHKKVVGVSQGTIATSYADLVVPTIRGLAHRDDILLVVVLGVKGAELPRDLVEVLPANTRVVDYLPYDALLPYVDVWVSNAGYGGFLHAVANGVPMVLGGQSEDKAEVSMRGEWSGVAHNLRTGRPTAEQVAAGVEEVLGDPEYKRRVMEIKKENEELRTLDCVERHIWEFADSV